MTGRHRARPSNSPISMRLRARGIYWSEQSKARHRRTVDDWLRSFGELVDKLIGEAFGEAVTK